MEIPKTLIENIRKDIETKLGVPVRLNVRPNRRSDTSDPFAEPGLYNTQVEFELYIPGPLQEAEIAAAKAAEEARQEAEAAAAAGASAAEEPTPEP